MAGGVLKAALLVSLLILVTMIKGESYDSMSICGVNVTDSQICPDHDQNIWQCLANLKNCQGSLKYHCAKDSGIKKFVEACGHSRICEEGLEPQITFLNKNIKKDADIYCEQCSDRERFNPYKNTSSDSFSECPEEKNSCFRQQGMEVCDEPKGLDSHIKNRKCRCRMQDYYIIERPDALPGGDCTVYTALKCVYVGPCPPARGRNQTLFFNIISGKHECKKVCLDEEDPEDDNCVRLNNPTTTTTTTTKSTSQTTVSTTTTTEIAGGLSVGEILGISTGIVVICIAGVIAVVVIVVLKRRVKKKRGETQNTQPTEGTSKSGGNVALPTPVPSYSGTSEPPGTSGILEESFETDDVKSIIDKCRIQLKYILDTKKVVIRLKAKGIFTSYEKKTDLNDIEDLCDKLPKSECADKLIKFMYVNSTKYKDYKDCLRETEQEEALHLLKEKEENLKEDKLQCDDESTEDDNHWSSAVDVHMEDGQSSTEELVDVINQPEHILMSSISYAETERTDQPEIKQPEGAPLLSNDSETYSRNQPGTGQSEETLMLEDETSV